MTRYLAADLGAESGRLMAGTFDGERVALELHRRAERFKNLRHEPRVAQPGHVADDARFGGQQRRRHDGQRGIFAAADGHFAVQWHAAFD